MDPLHDGAQARRGIAVMPVLTQFRSFGWPSRVLMINQFGINLGFYMLMPYLAGYLAGPLGLAGWAVGLVLGVRNFSQQGMFIVGGTLADRLGYKPLIVAGCLLRTAAFGLLAVAQSLPALLIASAATGFAGALFNPAVRAYLAADSGERRVAAFTVFNVFYQGGILAGPLVGLALMGLDFRVTAGMAAVVFAVLTIAQLFALPKDHADHAVAERVSVLHDWRTVLANRPFLLFAASMVGTYVVTFQVYLALPLHAGVLSPRHESAIVAAVFAVSGLVAIGGQIRITAWFTARYGRAQSLTIGVLVLAAAFVPLIVVPDDRWGQPAAVAALLLTAALLAVGSAAIYPFEMDTVVSLAGDRLVATYYGFYNTIVGVGILVGNLATGALMETARHAGRPELVWVSLTAISLLVALALYRSRRLEPQPVG